MAEIVGSLFGVSPEMLQQSRAQQDYARNLQAVQLTPMQQGNLMLRQGATELGNVGMGLLGIQDPEMQKVTAIKQLSSQFDLSSPEGMRQFAQALQPIAPNESMMAAKRADEMQSAIGARGLQAAQTVRAMREPTRTALSTLIASGKYTPASIALYEKSENPADLVLVKGAKGEGEGDGAGVAGPVGKSGAYRDADGIVYSATEMAKQRAGFQGLEKLADNLNSITAEDVKNAESFFDYTQGETLKTIGGKISPKTISAQAKINASQLLKQIESLPPGSASNADMIAAKSSFPGYGNADNLNNWIRDTKQLLAASMQRQSEQYGFKQKVQVKGLDGATTPETKGGPKTRTLKSGVVVTVQE